MSSLIEVLLTFVGVMLVLALAAQSLQELLKTAFTVKGQTTLAALRALVIEAARSQKLWKVDGEEIVAALTARLGALGQAGWRAGAVRLDALEQAQLGELIGGLSPVSVRSLSGIDAASASACLSAIAAQAVRWYPLAMQPVDLRYRRRMRVFALGASAVVVLAVNADALGILNQARRDPAYRAQAAILAGRLDSLLNVERNLAQPVPESASVAARDSALSTLAGARDSVRAAVGEAMKDEGLLSGKPGPWRVRDPKWWMGILLSTLLVSLGAPFWHDVLESVFSLKGRASIAAKAPKPAVEAT